MYLEIRYFYFIWKSDKTVCSRRGQFPLRGKGKGPLAQRSLPLRPPPETWGTPPVPHAPSWHKGAGLQFEHRRTNRFPAALRLPTGVLPRKRLAYSAPGGASPLSPLETPPGARRGSGSEKRSRGCPLCDPTNAMPANAGTHSGHLGTFSAAGRRLLIFVGSPYRSLPRMGELTQACQLIPKYFFFSTVHGAFSF